MDNQLTQEAQPAIEERVSVQQTSLTSFYAEILVDDKTDAIFYLVNHYGRFDFGNRITCRRWHDNIL